MILMEQNFSKTQSSRCIRVARDAGVLIHDINELII
jgi:hypothetical protein